MVSMKKKKLLELPFFFACNRYFSYLTRVIILRSDVLLASMVIKLFKDPIKGSFLHLPFFQNTK